MKAAVCREFGKPLTIEDVTLAPPGPREIKVKVAACAICHSDIHYAQGAWGGKLPAVYGHEAAGMVDSVGAGVTGFRPGDHVVVTLIQSCGVCSNCTRGQPAYCMTSMARPGGSPLSAGDGSAVVQGLSTGAFAEYVVVHESQAVAIPKDIALDAASLLACGVITGVGAVFHTAAVRPGDSAVVIGAGGVGLNSIQGAALAGASPIIAIDIAESKLAAAKKFGATHGVNGKTEDVAARVREIIGEGRADFAFVTVGSKAAIEQAMTLIGRMGAVVVVGMPATGVTASFDPSWFAFDGQRILGSRMGGARIATDIPKLLEFYHQGRLKLDDLISGRYPLERINEAIASVTRGEALRNVITF